MDDFEDDVCSRLSTSPSLMFCWKGELENWNEQKKGEKLKVMSVIATINSEQKRNEF